MKALFLVDNIMAMRMFAPIITALPRDWECLFINFDGWTEQSRAKIDDYASELGIRCRLHKKQNKQGVCEIIDEENPSVIVFAREEATPTECLFAEMSLEKGIPTLLVPHGALMSDMAMMNLGSADSKLFRIRHLCWLAGQAYKKLRREKISIFRLIQIGLFRIRNDFQNSEAQSRYDRYTKIATFGETMKDMLLTRHVKPESIVITGSTKFDAYVGMKDYKLNAGRKRILIFTDYLADIGVWSIKQRAEYILAIYRLNQLDLNIELAIKIHPTVEEKKDYAKIIRCYTHSPSIYKEETLPELINECDIAITLTSSAGLEAMSARKPLVIYNPFGDITIYDELSGAYIANSEDELRKVVGELFGEGIDTEHMKMADKFVYNHTYIQDGKASERIAKLIEEMV